MFFVSVEDSELDPSKAQNSDLQLQFIMTIKNRVVPSISITTFSFRRKCLIFPCYGLKCSCAQLGFLDVTRKVVASCKHFLVDDDPS